MALVGEVEWEAPLWSTDFKGADRLCGGPGSPASWLSHPVQSPPFECGLDL